LQEGAAAAAAVRNIHGETGRVDAAAGAARHESGFAAAVALNIDGTADERDVGAGVCAHADIAAATTDHVQVGADGDDLAACSCRPKSGIAATSGGEVDDGAAVQGDDAAACGFARHVAAGAIHVHRKTGGDDMARLSAEAHAGGEQCGDAAAERRVDGRSALENDLTAGLRRSGGGPIAVDARSGTESDGAVGLGQTTDAAAVERVYRDVVGGDLCARGRVDRRTSVERRVGSDGARSGGKRDSAAAGNRASLSSRVVEKAAASEQSKGRQQKL
jgi:hypothetical protein